MQLRTLLASSTAALGAAALLACGGPSQEQAPDTTTPAVEAVQARAGALPLVETLSGVVRARNQVAIRPEISAPIVEVLVQTGDQVAVGQPLVRLDQQVLAEQARQAEASLELAEASAEESAARVEEALAQVTRTRALHADDLVSDLELDTQESALAVARAQANQANARVSQARATLAERRNAMARAVVRAPVAGRVGQRNAEVGMLAESSTTLFILGDFSELIVEVPLTESLLNYIETGQRVEIASRGWELSRQGDSEPIGATLSRISPFLSAGSFSTTGEIDLGDADGRLQPGMFVNARIFYGETETATLVPNSALWDDPTTGVEGVWVVKDMKRGTEPVEPGTDLSEEEFKVALQPVTVLARGRSSSGVQGITEGSWVVTVGQQLLSEEQSVRRARNNSATESKAEPILARVRPTAWERVVELQGLQREDLLRRFLEKQRRIAKELGPRIPETSQSVEDALRESAGGGTAGGL